MCLPSRFRRQPRPPEGGSGPACSLRTRGSGGSGFRAEPPGLEVELVGVLEIAGPLVGQAEVVPGLRRSTGPGELLCGAGEVAAGGAGEAEVVAEARVVGLGAERLLQQRDGPGGLAVDGEREPEVVEVPRVAGREPAGLPVVVQRLLGPSGLLEEQGQLRVGSRVPRLGLDHHPEVRLRLAEQVLVAERRATQQARRRIRGVVAAEGVGGGEGGGPVAAVRQLLGQGGPHAPRAVGGVPLRAGAGGRGQEEDEKAPGGHRSTSSSGRRSGAG